MHKYAFPRCHVNGPILPIVPYCHLGLNGGIPKKCERCRFLFEGDCTRGSQTTSRYMQLDHGPCGVHGPTDPVVYEDQWLRAHVEVPRKCSTCIFLQVDRIRGFTCANDAEQWGDFPRGLDWGHWEPHCTWIQLPPPKITTRPLMQFATAGNLAAFIKEYRALHPDLPLAEAKADYEFIRQHLGLQP